MKEHYRLYLMFVTIFAMFMVTIAMDEFTVISDLGVIVLLSINSGFLLAWGALVSKFYGARS